MRRGEVAKVCCWSGLCCCRGTNQCVFRSVPSQQAPQTTAAARDAMPCISQIMFHLETFGDVLELFRSYAAAIAHKAQVGLPGCCSCCSCGTRRLQQKCAQQGRCVGQQKSGRECRDAHAACMWFLGPCVAACCAC